MVLSDAAGSHWSPRNLPVFAVPVRALTVDQTWPACQRCAMWDTLKSGPGTRFDLCTPPADPWTGWRSFAGHHVGLLVWFSPRQYPRNPGISGSDPSCVLTGREQDTKAGVRGGLDGFLLIPSRSLRCPELRSCVGRV
ncbi:hypothetical protein RRG08_016779 [Elysia crispata]|uniref:Uncharacterized protein n=1 Tax=Elysia crispata TaxID=231223 RepID=A0AAE0ZZG5_9GAST|nr:hypothetical protein RRG08_016779 [Elysia crispata]